MTYKALYFEQMKHYILILLLSVYITQKVNAALEVLPWPNIKISDDNKSDDNKSDDNKSDDKPSTPVVPNSDFVPGSNSDNKLDIPVGPSGGGTSSPVVSNASNLLATIKVNSTSGNSTSSFNSSNNNSFGSFNNASPPPTSITTGSTTGASTTLPGPQNIVAGPGSEGAYHDPVPVYCMKGKRQMGLLAIQRSPIDAITKGVEGVPVLENTEKTPILKGQIPLMSLKNLCSDKGGVNFKRLRKDLKNLHFDVAVLSKIE